MQGQRTVHGILNPRPRVETAPKTRFRDVPQSSPFYKEIEWLANEKITTGWPDGTFRPDAGVERAAMAAYFYRMAGSPPVTLPARSPFRDVAPQDQFYREICLDASARYRYRLG